MTTRAFPDPAPHRGVAMSKAADCIIEAGTVLRGVDANGVMRVEKDAALIVRGGRIAEIVARDSVAARTDLPRHGGPGMIAMPGLVNAHHHFGLTPLMLGVPLAPLELWLPRFRGMRQVSARLDTLYSAIEMLESGTTTVHHIHSGFTGAPENWHATTSGVLSAYAEIGMRVGFSVMMRDRNTLTYRDDAEVLATLPPDLRAWLGPRLAATKTPTTAYMDFFVEAKKKWQAEMGERIRFNLAPANLHWCTDESLELIFSTARSEGANVHMHLVETARQAAYAQETYGRTAVAHLAAKGWLGPNVTLGHGNWMTREDLELVAGCGCAICHNASSGLRLGSGIAPVNQMRARGIPVALGIDQSNLVDDRDMTIEMKLVWALHRETGLWNPRPDAAAVLQMATEHGAASTGFGGRTGRLEPGLEADVVLMSEKAIGRPIIDPRTPVAEAVLHRGSKAAIDKVFVAGELVVDRGRVTRIDRDAVLEEIADSLSRPASAEETEARAMIDRLMPYLEAFHKIHTAEPVLRPYRYNAMDEG
ncbi:MAG TPA: amidohydrolase family protein [Devosiaceae bacterium]|nr:amidohydrolase family protein [Devosiaceae bacterium]